MRRRRPAGRVAADRGRGCGARRVSHEARPAARRRARRATRSAESSAARRRCAGGDASGAARWPHEVERHLATEVAATSVSRSGSADADGDSAG